MRRGTSNSSAVQHVFRADGYTRSVNLLSAVSLPTSNPQARCHSSSNHECHQLSTNFCKFLANFAAHTSKKDSVVSNAGSNVATMTE